jgi:hypothetical protein
MNHKTKRWGIEGIGEIISLSLLATLYSLLKEEALHIKPKKGTRKGKQG